MRRAIAGRANGLVRGWKTVPDRKKRAGAKQLIDADDRGSLEDNSNYHGPKPVRLMYMELSIKEEERKV